MRSARQPGLGSTWNSASDQLENPPPLDFYYSRTSNPQKFNIRRTRFGPDAVPHTSWVEACRVHGHYTRIVANLPVQSAGQSDVDYDNYIHDLIWHPFFDWPVWRDCLVRTLTAVNGPATVFERFWAFWVNHFTVSSIGKDSKIFYGLHIRNIRNRMTGSFADMLRDAVINPAMLDFLDNKLSAGLNSFLGRRNFGVPNENHAREILELHTMSPAGGYTQTDVEELTLALTGWGHYNGHPEDSVVQGSPYGLYFNWKRHEPGDRTIMGKAMYQRPARGCQSAPKAGGRLALALQVARALGAAVPAAEPEDHRRSQKAWKSRNHDRRHRQPRRGIWRQRDALR